jgi:hypothetical protein
MSTLTFDTLKFAKTLTAAGVPSAQAEAEAEALANALEESGKMASLATKQDVDVLQKDIAVVKAELEVKIAETKADLVRWVVGVGVLQTAMIAALLLKLLPG